MKSLTCNEIGHTCYQLSKNVQNKDHKEVFALQFKQMQYNDNDLFLTSDNVQIDVRLTHTCQP